MNKKSSHGVFIDVTSAGTVAITLVDGEKIVASQNWRGRCANVLFLLDKFLQKHQLSLKNLRGIVLLEGGGTFSGVRQAAAVLNVLRSQAKVPVAGIDKRKYGEDWVTIIPAGLRALKRPGFIKPVYSGEPNITSRHEYAN